MRSELYMKLLQDVEDLLLSRQYGDIGMGYVMLTINALANEKDKIAYLQSILKDKNGTGRNIGKRVTKSVKEFQQHTRDMGYRDDGES